MGAGEDGDGTTGGRGGGNVGDGTSGIGDNGGGADGGSTGTGGTLGSSDSRLPLGASVKPDPWEGVELNIDLTTAMPRAVKMRPTTAATPRRKAKASLPRFRM